MVRTTACHMASPWRERSSPGVMVGVGMETEDLVMVELAGVVATGVCLIFIVLMKDIKLDREQTKGRLF